MTAKKVIPKVLLAVFVIAFVAICCTTGSITAAGGTLWALLPPVIAIGLALITKEVYSSLFIGIVVGGLLASDFSAVGTVNAVVQVGIVEAVKGTAGIFVFLVILFVVV